MRKLGFEAKPLRNLLRGLVEGWTIAKMCPAIRKDGQCVLMAIGCFELGRVLNGHPERDTPANDSCSVQLKIRYLCITKLIIHVQDTPTLFSMRGVINGFEISCQGAAHQLHHGS